RSPTSNLALRRSRSRPKAGTHRTPPTPSHLPVARTTAAADGGRRPRRCHRVPNGRFETCGDSRVIAAAVHTVHCGSLTTPAIEPSCGALSRDHHLVCAYRIIVNKRMTFTSPSTERPSLATRPAYGDIVFRFLRKLPRSCSSAAINTLRPHSYACQISVAV